MGGGVCGREEGSVGWRPVLGRCREGLWRDYFDNVWIMANVGELIPWEERVCILKVVCL